MKKSFDLIASFVALLLLSPLMLVLACVVRIKLGGPILFKQLRPGINGKPFELVKFRTMTNLEDPHGRRLPDSERLPKFGRILRATSLDELPELWNVLKGDMSLVGPRPLLMEYLDLYSPEQARRHEVLPGITGWVQVNGRNALTWDEKFALDIWYVDNRSMWLDIKILFLTIAKVFTGDGVSQQGSVTMEKFRGSK